ncbi:hypothetical protein LIER_37176 [Lithospermum erythrorhizon]|uniref:Uncharacterized protein n=1 Tax=Lithospermum erythrorhizon TaxID=34254 RepID=A0AAV3PGI5_LITER
MWLGTVAYTPPPRRGVTGSGLDNAGRNPIGKRKQIGLSLQPAGPTPRESDWRHPPEGVTHGVPSPARPPWSALGTTSLTNLRRGGGRLSCCPPEPWMRKPPETAAYPWDALGVRRATIGYEGEAMLTPPADLKGLREAMRFVRAMEKYSSLVAGKRGKGSCVERKSTDGERQRHALLEL